MKSQLIETTNLVCPICSQINRVPSEKLTLSPICGHCKTALLDGKPIELCDSTFEKFVSRTTLPIVVDFWAPWCGPCNMMAPAFFQAAQLVSPHVVFAKLNTQDASYTARQYSITSIPTLIFFEGDCEKARQSGAMSAQQIVQWVKGLH